MAKNFKTIICPQCNATEAERLSDGSFRCKYCGCVFIIDDDAKTQNTNINQNINVNININNSNNYYSSESASTRNNGGTKMNKQLRNVFFNLIAFASVILFISIRSCYSKSHIDDKQNGTLSQNLKGEKVIVTKPMVCHGKPAFLTISEDTYGSAKHLNMIFADNFEASAIASPVSLDKDFPGIFLPQNEDWYIVSSNSKIYHFDYQKLAFNEITDSVVNLFPKLKETGVEAIKWAKRNTERVFSITSSDGKEYFYHPASKMVYDEKSVQNIQAQEVVIKDTIWYSVSQDDATLIKNEIKDKKTSDKNIKQLDINKPLQFYSDGQFILLQYQKNGIVFFQKIDTQGNEIWTKKSDYLLYEVKPDCLYTDSLAIVHVVRYDEYYNPDFHKYTYLRNRKTDCFLFIRQNGDEISYVKMSN